MFMTTLTLLFIILSSTHTRSECARFSRTPNCSANGPETTRTLCPCFNLEKQTPPVSSTEAWSASTIPLKTGTGTPFCMTIEATPSVPFTERQLSRCKSSVMNKYRGNSGARIVLDFREWRMFLLKSGRKVLKP